MLIYTFMWAHSLIRASTIIYKKLISNILRAPLQFFHTTPIGRVLTRCSRDIDIIDHSLPYHIKTYLNAMFGVMSCVFVLCYNTPLICLVILPVSAIYYYINVSALIPSLPTGNTPVCSWKFEHADNTIVLGEVSRKYIKDRFLQDFSEILE